MDGQSERRVITALFIDVVGSTDLMMRIGPEVMRRRLADAFDQISHRITEHGGTVENFAGDAVFAIFGAPTAHVDDPERALRAARACADWSKDSIAHDHLGIRVGVETGEALVDLAAVGRHERMAIGRCVNIAARLQQQGDRGKIVAGPGTYAATAGVAEYEELGSLHLKGVGELNGWRFVGFSSGEGAAHVPFVGREQELGMLRDAATRAAEGMPTLALIVGDPGLGKSRLAAELIHAVGQADRFRVLHARCRPAGEEGANTPLRQLVEADIPGATPVSVRQRLVELLDRDDGDVAAIPILHSAGLEANAELQAITRYEQRETIARAWLRYLSALAAQQPLLVAVEDLHWADPVLVRTLDYVSAEARSPIFVIVTARPEFVSSAHLRPAENRIQIELKPLDRGAARALAEAARGSVAGLDRAEGNPLFIIELARAKSSAADLPMTIQAAIAARLDELSQEERQLLQQVAVAGETFDVRDAALLADREPAEVAGMLGRVAHLGFVQPAGPSFRFHHALVRDVAYGRLPVSTRLALHARYADAGVAPNDQVARAFHLWEAAKPPDAEWAWEDASRLQALRAKAFDAQLEAGKELEASNQYEQAEVVYRRASELAADARSRGDSLAELGRVMARQGKGDDGWATRNLALQAYAQGGVEPPSRVYAEMLENVVMNWGYFHELPADTEVWRLLDEGAASARRSGDEVSLARLLMERASFSGDASGLSEVLPHFYGPDAVKFADPAHRSAQVLMWSGQLAESIALYRHVFDELLPRGAVFNEPEALTWYGLAAFCEGDLELASELVDHARADMAKGRSAHTQSHVDGLRSLVAFGRGDWPDLLESTRELEKVIAASPDVPFCLVGAFAVGWGGVARILEKQPLTDLDADAARMIEEMDMVRAASILLPKAMLGRTDAIENGRAAYAPDLGLWDRAAAWDVLHLVPALVGCVVQRWEMLDEPLARLDYCAAGGSRLAAAAATALREERAAAIESGPEAAHGELLALGYRGISELMRFRAQPPLEAAA